jgi:hypothetical protein
MAEPTITINGTTLTYGQAMTMRVALESFAIDLRTAGLGGDVHGLMMVEGYTAAIQVIRQLMRVTK